MATLTRVHFAPSMAWEAVARVPGTPTKVRPFLRQSGHVFYKQVYPTVQRVPRNNTTFVFATLG
ncbi:MAG: hypothetical protein ACXWVJ_04090, partial [Caulobacteraceae bacterium]